MYTINWRRSVYAPTRRNNTPLTRLIKAAEANGSLPSQQDSPTGSLLRLVFVDNFFFAGHKLFSPTDRSDARFNYACPAAVSYAHGSCHSCRRQSDSSIVCVSGKSDGSGLAFDTLTKFVRENGSVLARLEWVVACAHASAFTAIVSLPCVWTEYRVAVDQQVEELSLNRSQLMNAPRRILIHIRLAVTTHAAWIYFCLHK